MHILAAVLLLAASGAASAADGIANMAWLQGCWSEKGAEAGSGEVWMSPAGGSMIGMSRTIKGGKTTEFEFLQLREVDGKLHYLAMPQGRPPTTFKQIRLSDSEVAFENPEHDFPQRIIYRKDGERGLHARIEGTRNGKERGIDFPMQRIACEAK